MMLYVVLYQSKLIPRWLSVWGMIAVVLHLALTGVAGLANVHESSLIQVAANAPILVQEMVMAGGLIVKGSIRRQSRRSLRKRRRTSCRARRRSSIAGRRKAEDPPSLRSATGKCSWNRP
ncbi:MAG: DUF4386 domain-containing protein [Anaerolineales bacterium]|nr:DUF4386 domain-containing protein [Anaerolineales bacterium]